MPVRKCALLRTREIAGSIILLTVISAASEAAAANFVDLPVLKSSHRVLDILMVARADRLPFGPFDAEDWIYDICPRPTNGALHCPSSPPNPYGGTRLQLNQGDTLKVRLVNKLPPAVNAKHQYDPGMDYLGVNPTNLHTHGMLVSAHFPSMGDRTYGDNVFVTTLNPSNGLPTLGQHIEGDVRNRFTDYRIQIPANHPSGLFWFHPHIHGISLNQISAGMSGIITIGNISDYLCTTECGLPPGGIPVRHLLLKDTQVVPPGALADQQDPAYCDQFRAAGDPPRKGNCLATGGAGTGMDRGRWYFSVNGQQYPNIAIAAPMGEIWRITNASASVAYDLSVRDANSHSDMLMQVIAIDGVSVSGLANASTDAIKNAGGPAFVTEACPGGTDPAKTPLCVRHLKMFPSSRVEVWVTYRDSLGAPARPSSPVRAVLSTNGVSTGPIGDAWPRVDLASVVFRPQANSNVAAAALTVTGGNEASTTLAALASEFADEARAFAPGPDCTPLAAGHTRRIFFNSVIKPSPVGAPPKKLRGKRFEEADAGFGLGYEELDEQGNPIARTKQDILEFDPTIPTICLTLGPGNTPVYERWQLINLAGEDHNFHMHQTKFALLTRDVTEHSVTPRRLLREGVLHDNVPLQHADGNCLTADDWRAGLCTAHPVTVEIPFTVPGDYVYHCHILEHEDGGMMARIRVRAAP